MQASQSRLIQVALAAEKRLLLTVGMVRGALIHPVILCGGAGTRLWPLSRKDHPKQFLSFSGSESLLQSTAQRLRGDRFAPPTVVTADDFRFTVAHQLPIGEFPDRTIIIEPEARNTAPAMVAAVLHLHARYGAVDVLVAPSDHLILDAESFRQALVRGVAASDQGRIVTYGIRPNYPETGYGYIEIENPISGRETCPIPIKRFIEKPSLSSAVDMVQSGRFLWNAGVFLFRTDVLIAAAREHAPEVLSAVQLALDESFTDLSFLRLGVNGWQKSPKISIDYAVMEKARNLSVMPYHGQWSDLGGWDAVLRETSSPQDNLSSKGNVTAINCSDTLLRAEGDRIALVGLGLKNIIAVAMDDAVLVADRSAAQEVKAAVEILKAQGRRQAEHNPRLHRPWGTVETLFGSPTMHIRKVVMNIASSLSLQTHGHRSEHWIILRGEAEVRLEDREITLREGESIGIPRGSRHQLVNSGTIPLEFIEVQAGEYIDENDIIRYDQTHLDSGGP